MNATTADVVIIGGGILGAATAYYLSAAGHRVVLLERGAPNREGSGTTAGNLHIQAIHTRRPGQVVAADNGRFLPLQRTASSLWSTLEAELDEDIELTRNGGFMVAETPEQVADLHAKHALERALGIPSEVVSGDDARLEMPELSTSVIAADWCALDGYANPLLVTPAYLRAAQRHGASVYGFSPVTGITRAGDSYVVSSGDRKWSSAAVVDVAGPWIADVAELAGIRLNMSPVAIQMHVTNRVAPRTLRYLVQHIGEGMSVKQVTAGNILIGGGWPAATFRSTGRSQVSQGSISGNLWQASRVLPFLRELTLLRSWAGPLAATPDEMPVIGEVPGMPHFYVAGGTYAFTLAPLWGQTIRGLLEGTDVLEPIDDLGVDRLLLNLPARTR